jgi:phosphopantothenoylcysteine decarboxylase/phosphopantothenate--cysteine ligase
MHAAVTREIGDATIFIAAAAVADYRAKRPAPNKIKKSDAELMLELEPTSDILADVARHRMKDQLLVGFAAETDDVILHARQKLTAKQLDIVVANDVSREDAGFDSDNNAVTILVRDHSDAIEIPLASKAEVAERILDEVVKLRRQSTNAMTAESRTS